VNYPFNLIFLGNRNRVIQGLLTSGLVLSVYDFTHTHTSLSHLYGLIVFMMVLFLFWK